MDNTLQPLNDYVETRKEIMSGVPIIKNTRISVSLIIACLRDTMSIGEICQEYNLTFCQVTGALDYVIDILDNK